MINYAVFPRYVEISDTSRKVLEAFRNHSSEIESPKLKLESNAVLQILRKDLEKIGFSVEAGKKTSEKICVPVLFGNNGKIVKSFEADGYYKAEQYVLEVEAGRGVANNQFLKDFFQAIAMKDVKKLCIAVRNEYAKGKVGSTSKDFNITVSFFDTLFASNRLQLPFSEILIIGY